MLKIKPIRATLGKSVTAKLKNTKDDKERVVEFSISSMRLTIQQLTDLVACSKHERSFGEVAFVGQDAVSELRHFKKMELATEVHNAMMTLSTLKSTKDALVLADCSLKGIALSFRGDDRCEMSCKVWAHLQEHALYQLSEWGSQDLFVGVESRTHGEEQPDQNHDLDLQQS